MKKDSIIQLIALGGVPLLMVLGNSMLIPVFPEMQKTLNISQFQVGLTITLFSIPAGICIPILGFLSDKIGRKLIIVPSLILYAFGGVISGIAPIIYQQQAYPLLLAGRVVQGIGAAGTGPIAMALVSDIFTGNQRSQAQGSVEAANGLGKVISPILGSLIALLFWYAIFFVYAALAIPIALAVWFLIKEPKPKQKNNSFANYFQGIKKVFSQSGKSLIGSYLAASIVLFTLFGILSYLSDILEVEYGLKGVIKGFALAGPVLAMSITSFVSGRMLKNSPGLMKPFIVGGLAVLSLALIILSVFKINIIFFIAILIMGTGTGLVLPAVNTTVTSAAPLAERGGITALYGTVRFFGVAAGPPTYSKLLELGKGTMFWGGSGIALASLLISFFLVSKKELSANNQPETSSEDPNGSPDIKDEGEEHNSSPPKDATKVTTPSTRKGLINLWKPLTGAASGLTLLFFWLRRKHH